MKKILTLLLLAFCMACGGDDGPGTITPPPPADTDNDGVVDTQDNCPNQAGPAANNGCPWGDADNDGVNDNEDNCPNEAGPASNNGCPYDDLGLASFNWPYSNSLCIEGTSIQFTIVPPNGGSGDFSNRLKWIDYSTDPDTETLTNWQSSTTATLSNLPKGIGLGVYVETRDNITNESTLSDEQRFAMKPDVDENQLSSVVMLVPAYSGEDVGATISWNDTVTGALYDIYIDDALVSENQSTTSYDTGSNGQRSIRVVKKVDGNSVTLFTEAN